MKLVKDINKESSNKPQVSDKEAEEAIKKLLAWIGEDPSREGLPVSYTHLTLPTSR